MSANEIPHAGMRETVGDMLILLALLAVVFGVIGRDGAVLVASGPMLIGGLVLRRGRPTARLLSIPIPVPKMPPIDRRLPARAELAERRDGGGHSQHATRVVDV